MADLTLAADAGLEGQSILNRKPLNRQAGVAIVAGQPCYVDTNGLFQLADRDIQLASGTFGTVAKFDGVAVHDIASGSFGNVYGGVGVEARIQDSGLTIGQPIWLSATAGKWANAAPTANDNPVAHAISATSIILDR